MLFYFKHYFSSPNVYEFIGLTVSSKCTKCTQQKSKLIPSPEMTLILKYNQQLIILAEWSIPFCCFNEQGSLFYVYVTGSGNFSQQFMNIFTTCNTHPKCTIEHNKRIYLLAEFQAQKQIFECICFQPTSHTTSQLKKEEGKRVIFKFSLILNNILPLTYDIGYGAD